MNHQRTSTLTEMMFPRQDDLGKIRINIHFKFPKSRAKGYGNQSIKFDSATLNSDRYPRTVFENAFCLNRQQQSSAG